MNNTRKPFNQFTVVVVIVMAMFLVLRAVKWPKPHITSGSQTTPVMGEPTTTPQPVQPPASTKSAPSPELPPIPASLAPKAGQKMTPEMVKAMLPKPDPAIVKMAKMENAFSLLDLLDGIKALETKGSNTLSAAQAKSILAVVTDARSKLYLDEKSANDSMKSIRALLNAKQRREIGTLLTKQSSHETVSSGPQSKTAMPDMNPLTSPSRGKASVTALVTLLNKKVNAK